MCLQIHLFTIHVSFKITEWYMKDRFATRFIFNYMCIVPTSKLLLERFALECETFGMAIRTSKYEAMVFSHEGLKCTLQVWDWQVDQWGVCCNAESAPVWCGERRAEPKGNLSTGETVHDPTCTSPSDHELWVDTTRMRSQTQMTDMNFLPKVPQPSCIDRVTCSVQQLGRDSE